MPDERQSSAGTKQKKPLPSRAGLITSVGRAYGADGGASGMMLIAPILAVVAAVISKNLFGCSSWALFFIVMTGIFVPLIVLTGTSFYSAQKAQAEFFAKKKQEAAGRRPLATSPPEEDV